MRVYWQNSFRQFISLKGKTGGCLEMRSHRALLERFGTSFDGAVESYRNATGLTGLPARISH